jgi:hypothetical protein
MSLSEVSTIPGKIRYHARGLEQVCAQQRVATPWVCRCAPPRTADSAAVPEPVQRLYPTTTRTRAEMVALDNFRGTFSSRAR